MTIKRRALFNGRRLRELRRAAGLSIKTLARMIGVHHNAVQKWEGCKSQPVYTLGVALCEVFDCTMYELLNTEKVVNDNRIAAERRRQVQRWANCGRDERGQPNKPNVESRERYRREQRRAGH